MTKTDLSALATKVGVGAHMRRLEAVIDSRLRTIERHMELQSARLLDLEGQLKAALDDARQWRRNYETVLRKKESAFEALGRVAGQKELDADAKRVFYARMRELQRQ